MKNIKKQYIIEKKQKTKSPTKSPQKQKNKIHHPSKDNPQLPSKTKIPIQFKPQQYIKSIKKKCTYFQQLFLNYFQCFRIYHPSQFQFFNKKKQQFQQYQQQNRKQQTKSNYCYQQQIKYQSLFTNNSKRLQVQDQYQIPAHNFSSDQCFKFIKRYAETYDASYQQRKKYFGYTFQEVQRQRELQYQKKKKNLLIQLKRLICCRGGNQLQQLQQVTTEVFSSESNQQLNYVQTISKNSYNHHLSFFQKRQFSKQTLEEITLNKDRKAYKNVRYFSNINKIQQNQLQRYEFQPPKPKSNNDNNNDYNNNKDYNNTSKVKNLTKANNDGKKNSPQNSKNQNTVNDDCKKKISEKAENRNKVNGKNKNNNTKDSNRKNTNNKDNPDDASYQNIIQFQNNQPQQSQQQQQQTQYRDNIFYPRSYQRNKIQFQTKKSTPFPQSNIKQDNPNNHPFYNHPQLNNQLQLPYNTNSSPDSQIKDHNSSKITHKIPPKALHNWWHNNSDDQDQLPHKHANNLGNDSINKNGDNYQRNSIPTQHRISKSPEKILLQFRNYHGDSPLNADQYPNGYHNYNRNRTKSVDSDSSNDDDKMSQNGDQNKTLPKSSKKKAKNNLMISDKIFDKDMHNSQNDMQNLDEIQVIQKNKSNKKMSKKSKLPQQSQQNMQQILQTITYQQGCIKKNIKKNNIKVLNENEKQIPNVKINQMVKKNKKNKKNHLAQEHDDDQQANIEDI